MAFFNRMFLPKSRGTGSDTHRPVHQIIPQLELDGSADAGSDRL